MIAAPDTIDDCWNRIGIRGDQSCERLEDCLHCHNCPVHAAAARTIMQRRVPAGYAEAWAERFSQPPPAQHVEDTSAMVFRLGREWLALPTACFVSVADQKPVHRLPHRTTAILGGVVNIGGKLTPHLSLRAMLAVDDEQEVAIHDRHVYPRLVVLRFGDTSIAAPVDEVAGIVRFAAGGLQPVPATVNRTTSRYLSGVLALDNRQVGCLDAEMLATHVAEALR